MNDVEVGYVIESKDFLVFLDGLPGIRVHDMVQNEQGIKGLVNALYEDKIEVLLLDEGNVIPGQLFKRLNQQLSLDAGNFLLGRAITPLGVPIDGKGTLSKSNIENLELDRQATGIESRQFISDQFVTGITLIDTLVPLGKGQRELVMGDAHSGKTSFLIDLIINQKNTGVICIYASIGKTSLDVRNLIDTLKSNDALPYTVIIAAASSEPAPLIFLAPHAAFSVAEYFQKKGKDVLLILDDMGNHAKIYREISLLGGKAPGRESYPGDIFYQHAHLVERAGRFRKEYGGGSITCIPVIELNLNDFTAFVPTNLMSMTDGHLLFRANLNNIGQRPAVDIGLSVSRVGRQTQIKIQNLLSGKVRQVLAEAESLETISRFAQELPPETQLLLKQREFITELIKQEPLTLISREVQIILLGLTFTSFLKDKTVSFVAENKKKLIEGFIHDKTLLPITQDVLRFDSEDQLFKTLESAMPRLEEVCK